MIYKKLTIILILFAASAFAQNKVDYIFHIQDPCSGTASEFNGGTFYEGQSFVVKEQKLSELSQGLDRFQPIYNALVGSVFGIENGALDNDIKINIHLIGLTCESDQIVDPTGRGFEHFLYWGVVVESGGTVYGFDEFFPLTNGRAYLKIPSSASYLSLLDSLSINKDSVAFTYYVGDVVDPEGLEWAVGADTTTLYLNHFSKFGGGKGRIRKPTGIEEERNDILENYALQQNFPNPFNPSTTIRYSIPVSGHVSITLFDVLGNEIEKLVNREMPSGTHDIVYNSGRLSSGIYFYSMKSGAIRITRKMLLIK